MPKNSIHTCIIPAAGKGTRWAPITGYLPKEMLPLIDKPVIEWVIDEVAAAGCTQIIVVINKQKEVIKKYLSNNQKLKDKKIKLHFVYQEEPLGIAHAMYLAKDYVSQKAFVVALPDLPTIARKHVTKQLVKSFSADETRSHIISFDKFSNETAHLYGECLIKPDKKEFLKIIHFCPKQPNPSVPHHRGNVVRMSGRFIFTNEIFPIINKLIKERKEGEISDRTALREAQNLGQRVLGVRITGHTYDTGYPEGYVRANTAFFKKFAHKKFL